MKHKEEHIETFKEKILSQKKRITVGILIFIFLIVGILGIYIYNIKKESDARELEYEAYKYYAGLNKDSLSREQSYLKAGDLFLEAYSKKNNITYLLNAGYAYENAGQTTKALEVLNKVVNTKDENFSNLAKFKTAMIHLKNNNREQAVKILKEIYAGNSLVMKDITLFELGKITENENKEQAIKFYEELITKYPNSVLSISAKKSLEELKKQ